MVGLGARMGSTWLFSLIHLLLGVMESKKVEHVGKDMLTCGMGTLLQNLGWRQYYLRPPAHCTEGESLPLLVLLHCFGCDATHELKKFSKVADRFGFALAVPQGEGNSWNAPSCCGPARQRELDDFGFIDKVVQDATSKLPLVRSAYFAHGFSNGGFMVSHLPYASKTPWAAISPASGHEYSVQPHPPLPVYIHHCVDDTMVKMDGCCSDNQGTSNCCCGIGAQRDVCVPTLSLYESWLKVNRCQGTEKQNGPGGSDCIVGVGCSANTTICSHSNGCFHQQWSQRFPATEAVVEFFAREVCVAHTGRWHADTASCTCPATRRGRWCLAKGSNFWSKIKPALAMDI